MAEYILKDLIEEDEELKAQNWEILSAGISAVQGAQANEKAQSVMAEINIDIKDHNSHNVKNIELSKEDLIITMSRRHSRALVLQYPDLADKIFTLKDFSETAAEEGKDIKDPFGFSKEVYRETRDEIENNLSLLLEKLKNFELKEED